MTNFDAARFALEAATGGKNTLILDDAGLPSVMVRIPMFIYLSPEYQQALPGRTRAIRYHRSRYFTNDMLYDTISGLLNAPSSRYIEAQDLTSPNYAYMRANLTTMLGQQTLTDDPKGGTEQGF